MGFPELVPAHPSGSGFSMYAWSVPTIRIRIAIDPQQLKPAQLAAKAEGPSLSAYISCRPRCVPRADVASAGAALQGEMNHAMFDAAQGAMRSSTAA
jgi:hypothetical protein